MSFCSLALVLLMDVSGSVDAAEYALQRDGTAAAFRSAEVVRAIEAQPGGIAVVAIEWSTGAVVTVPWMRLRDGAESAVFADRLAATQRTGGSSTWMGPAFAAAARELDRAPCEVEREVVDISGDGQDDGGMEPAREALLARGAVINAVVVPDAANPGLADWFRAHVVTPGGMLFEADGYAAFGPAIRRKIVLEVAGR